MLLFVRRFNNYFEIVKIFWYLMALFYLCAVVYIFNFKIQVTWNSSAILYACRTDRKKREDEWTVYANEVSLNDGFSTGLVLIKVFAEDAFSLSCRNMCGGFLSSWEYISVFKLDVCYRKRPCLILQCKWLFFRIIVLVKGMLSRYALFLI